MKLWKENRKTGEWEIGSEGIAKQFLKSGFNSPGWLNSRGVGYSLRSFISDPSGLNSTWEEDCEQEVVDILKKSGKLKWE